MHRFVLMLLMFLPAVAWAQLDQPGWSFVQRFHGNTTDSGTIFKSDSTIGYAYHPYMNFYAGVPLYFSRPDARVAPGGNSEYINSLGNIYIGVQTPIRSDVAEYTSDLVLMLPTGSKDHGLNTGRLTFDWNNAIRRTFGSVTPFANIGIGNTIMDTAYFIRPFTSLGLNGHFEGGATLAIVPSVNIGGAAYVVRAANTQRILSRLIDRPFVRGPGPGLGRSDRVFETTPEIRVLPDLVHDSGFATWASATTEADLTFQVGYSRSAAFDYDTVFFGIGYRFGSLIR